MATFDDAKAGWEIYRASNFALTRDELNRRLIERGMAPISPRTFQHYKKLRRYGYYSYVPINQLDVKTLKDPLWDDAVRHRYPVYHKPVPVRLETRFRDEQVFTKGYTTELSPAVISCKIDEPGFVERLQNPSFKQHIMKTRLVVCFVGTNERYGAHVEQVTEHAAERSVVLTMRFVSLTPVELVTNRELLPTATIRLRFVPNRESPLLSETVRKLYWFFQVVETGKVIGEELMGELGLDQYAMPSVRVKKLSMGSPLDVLIWVGVPAFWLLKYIVREILKARTEYYEGNVRRELARNLKLQNDVLEAAAQLVKDHFLTLAKTPEEKKRLHELKDKAEVRWRQLAQTQLLPSLFELLDDPTGTTDLKFDQESHEDER